MCVRKEMVLSIMLDEAGDIEKDYVIFREVGTGERLLELNNGNGEVDGTEYEDLRTIYYHALDMLRPLSVRLEEMDEEEFESLQKENDELKARIKQLQGDIDE